MKNPTTFSSFLKEKNYKEKTIFNMEKSVNLFKEFTEKHRIQPPNATYENLLDYIRFCRSEENKPVTVNKKLAVLRIWFAFLISTGKRKTNPALDLQVKVPPQTIKIGLLDDEQLQKLYDSYPENNIADKRNKLILSLVIFQGLTTREIFNLRTEDIDLQKAQIRIRENTVSQGRTLRLESVQILLLLSQIKPEKDKLFSRHKTIDSLTQSVKKWLKQNRYPTLSALRSSVITNWLKRYNLRQVQYMAGHRKVQATENYKTKNMELLKSEIENFHPMSSR